MSKQSWYGGGTPSPFVGKNELKRSWYTGSSVSLVITFLLGVGVGFFLRYAWFELRQEQQKEPVAVVESVPVDAVEEAPPEAGVTDLKVTPQPADLEAVWPARHLIVGIPGTTLDADSAELLNQYKPGGVWLRASNTLNDVQIRSLVDQAAPLAALEPVPAAMPLVMAAQDGGPDGNVLHLPQAPAYEEIAQFETLEAIRESGKNTAARALELGVGMLLSPVLDVYDEAVRSASERPHFLGTTPESVARAGIAYIEGLQEGGALAVAKHYPGIGSATLNEGALPLIKEENVDNLSATMQVFVDAAANDVAGILISGATIPMLDTEMPGRPTALSPAMVREVLRRRCGFDGVLIAEDMRAIAPWSENTVAQNCVAALAAGCDAVLIASVSAEEMAAIMDAIKQAVNSGVLDDEELLLSRQRLDLCRAKLARTMGREDHKTPPESTVTEGENTEGEAEEDSTSEKEVAEGQAEAAPTSTTEPASEGEQTFESEGAIAEPVETMPEPDAEEAPAWESSAEAPVAQGIIPPEGTLKVVHTIKQGDTLTRIANTYGVSIKDIMQWNGLEDANIKFGRKLDIYTVAEEPKAAGQEPEATEDKEAAATAEELAAPEATAPETDEPPVRLDTEETPAPLQDDTSVTEDSPASPDTSEPATEKAAPEAPESTAPDADEPPPAPEEMPAAPVEASRDAEEESIDVDTTFPPADVFPEDMSNADGPPETLPLDTPPPVLSPDDSVAEPAETVPPILPGGEAANARLSTSEPEMTVTEIPAVPSPILEPDALQNLPEPPAAPPLPAGTDSEEAAAAPAMTAQEDVPETPAPAEGADTGHKVHVVGPGETLNKIANKYGVTVKQLLAVNTFDNPDVLFVGSEIYVPNP